MDDLSTLNTATATIGSVIVGLVTATVAIYRGKQTAKASMKETAYTFTLDLLKAERDERGNLMDSINQLRDEMQQQDQHVRQLRQDLHSAQEEIAALRARISEQDDIIKRQEAEIGKLRLKT